MSDGAKESVERPAVWFDACPHCGHHMNPVEKVKSERWGEYDWEIVCSSSHCRARMRIVADGWSEQIDADRNPHIQPDQLYRDRLTQLSRMWNRRATPPAAPAGGERETLRQLFEDHYWDSFQTDKQIVMKHVNCVLDFWAASQGAFERSDIALDGQEVAGCSARKCPEPGEAGVEGSIPSRSTNIATPAQSIDDEREREAAIERIISIRNGMTTDPEARAIVRRELAALAALKETT